MRFDHMNNIPLRISELPIGRTKAYQEINEGRLRAVKCGKLTLILPEDYDQWLKSLPPVVAKSAIDGGQ
jgi:excisionase family DNA binding protein